MSIEPSSIDARGRMVSKLPLGTVRRKPTALVLLGVLLLTSCFYMPSHTSTKREMPKDFSKVSVFPKFAKVSESQISKEGRNTVTTYFKSADTYEEVKSFYVSTLTHEGWTVIDEQDIEEWFKEVGGKELGFSKAGASVIIQYRGEYARNNDWDYAVSFTWND